MVQLKNSHHQIANCYDAGLTDPTKPTMFDFIFKRSPRKTSSPQEPIVEQKQVERSAQASGRVAAMAQAEALSGLEAAAVDFILQCEFAEARLKAAENVVSPQQLEQVLQAMRNTDRRVAKLMQSRLDALQQQAVVRQRAQACIDQALRLTQEPQLLANQVVDLDRNWLSVVSPPALLREAFDQARAALRERLEAQAALQRAVIDLLARLRKAGESADLNGPDQLAQTLDLLEQEMARHEVSPEASSLPKTLLPEFRQLHQNLKQALGGLTQRHAAIAARRALLEQWEADPSVTPKEDSLLQAWKGLPTLPPGELMAAFQTRFDALRQRSADALKSTRAAVQEAKQERTQQTRQQARQQFSEALEAMEKALQDGALQAASEHDKILRLVDLKAAQLTEAEAAQLARARGELGRLQGWAKWGGNVSREELLKAAEGLPGQELAVLELAKKVGSLRERWKSLDVSAGPSSRELWERFDAACGTAYAPAAAHFKRLADERQQNQLKAQAMIAELGQFAADSGCAAEDNAAVDWKAVAAFCARATQAWQRLGTIDRKEKKRLDAEFERELQILSAPLDRQRDHEIRRREKLITEVAALNPGERSAPEALRALQERWQEQAKALPLARRDEQELWQRFRAACDAVFAKRKEEAVAADADRQQHLQAKQDLCASLETALGTPDAAVGKLLREVREAWTGIGPLPRASEAQIEARYKNALAALQAQLDVARRNAALAQASALRDKLVLCQKLEAAVASGVKSQADALAAWQLEWQALPPLSGEFERALQRRFDAGQAALQSDAAPYGALLEQNRERLAHELLRFEIMLRIDSPPALSRERLKLQVEVLQSSLKAGQKPATPETQMLQLCGIAAPADEQTMGRLDQAIAAFKTALAA